MKAISLDDLTEKLKDTPQSILERVLGYVDALTEPNKPYKLTKEQQQILDEQLNADKSNYKEAGKVYDELKEKYGLKNYYFGYSI
jgi:hypothetical protein